MVGESEKNLAKLFAQARSNAPCLLFIDQVGGGGGGGKAIEEPCFLTWLFQRSICCYPNVERAQHLKIRVIALLPGS